MANPSRFISLFLAFVISSCAVLLMWTYRAPIREALFPAKPATDSSTQAHAESYGSEVVLMADGSGHYFLDATVDREHIRFLIDTGASTTVLSYDDAEDLGFDPDKLEAKVRVNTGGGQVEMAQVSLPEIEAGNLRISHVDALIAPEGGMSQSVLGMNFLRRLRSYSVESGKMTLMP